MFVATGVYLLKTEPMRLLFILCFAITTPVLAQPPMPFPEANAQWSVNAVNMGVFQPYGSYGIVGDTLIDSLIYRKIAFSNSTLFDITSSTYHSAMRDDDGKWYAIPQSENTEYLLYDFTGEVGDTIIVNNPFEPSQPAPLVVISIDTLEYESLQRRTWILETSFGWQEYWYEGIGSWTGLFHHITFAMDFGHVLVCFHENDWLIHQKEDFINCESTVGIAAVYVGVKPIFAPNPASGVVHIHHDMRPIRTMIIDASGRLVLDASDVREIDVRLLPLGIYLVRIMDHDHRTHTAKLIVEH